MKEAQERAARYESRCNEAYSELERYRQNGDVTLFVASREAAKATAQGCTVYAGVLEEYMLGAIKDRLSEFQKLSGISDTELLSKVSGASGVLMKYIDEKIPELDTERKALQEEIVTANVTDSEDRQALVDTLINVIRIANGNIEITWNILQFTTKVQDTQF